jgi:alpha-glucosidase
MKNIILSFLLAAVFVSQNLWAQQSNELYSPNGKLKAAVFLTGKRSPAYYITFNSDTILSTSKLGILREDGDFSKGLQSIGISNTEKISDSYQLFTSKRSQNIYRANKKTFSFKNASGQRINIIFQLSNDGVAFRYHFPDTSASVKRIKEELTAFSFLKNSKAYIQPMDTAKGGFEHTYPSYEEHYQKGIATNIPSPSRAGWVFPALFESGKNWVLLSETSLQENYCASRLRQQSANNSYTIGFPEAPESFNFGPVNPQSMLPWFTPWRTITIGSLGTIVESTLGTDLANPPDKTTDISYIKPGKASWSWPIFKDDSTVFKVQKRFIDYAANMNWQYCLVDALWDKKIGFEKITALAKYAQSKNVGLLIWYNSAGDWNTTNISPLNKLLTKELRRSEFAKLQSAGVKGIKVDFFGGDGQSVIQYYRDILKDAADFKLMVNLHGSTLPRGLQRTFPNLLTAEAVRGFESVTFRQADADKEASHCAMLPFTRNVFDPMDYTPLSLDTVPNIKRKTSAAFQLALSVLFTSGIQHFVETPEGMQQVPTYVKEFLKTLPNQWDDVKFIDGFPGEYCIIARKTNNQWFIAGINASKESKVINADFSFIEKGAKMQMITDGEKKNSFSNKIVKSKKTTIQMKPEGGFIVFTAPN